MRRSIVVAVASLTLTAAACSSSGGGGKSASSNTGGSPTSSGAAASGGVADAQAYLTQWLKAPSTIGITEPLSAKPPTNKKVIGLAAGVDTGLVQLKYFAAAAKALGWDYKSINYESTPEAQQKAMETAIAENPDGIMISGISVSTITAQLAEAKEKGIAVNASAGTDNPSGALFDTSVGSAKQMDQWGKMVAAYVVVQSKGKAIIQDFSLPVFSILAAFDKAFQAAIKQWCPDCKVTEHPQQGADIGTKTPQSVVSTLQANPDTDWLVFDLGALTTGVDAALSAASVGEVNIGGLTASAPNIESLKAKKEDVWTGYPVPVSSYRQVDSMARNFLGDPILDAPLPTQLITQDNVDSIVTDSDGSYTGVNDFEAQFAKLWHVDG